MGPRPAAGTSGAARTPRVVQIRTPDKPDARPQTSSRRGVDRVKRILTAIVLAALAALPALTALADGALD